MRPPRPMPAPAPLSAPRNGILRGVLPKHFSLGMGLGPNRPLASDVTGPSRHLVAATGFNRERTAATCAGSCALMNPNGFQ